MVGWHTRPITHLETGKWVKTHPKQWGKLCWALLCPIQVTFQVQVGPKMGVFMVENSQNDRMPYWAKRSTWKLDNGSKRIPSNGNSYVGHVYAPSRCHSRSRWVRKWVFFGSTIAKITGCHIERRKQPGNRIMGQNTHRAMGIVMLGTFLPYPGGNKHYYYWSIISRIKFWRFSFFSEIVFWKNIRFFRVTILGLVYPNSTQTFEDLYSLTRLEKAPGSFIRGLYGDVLINPIKSLSPLYIYDTY